MEQRKSPCPLAWCDAAHNDDTPTIRHHHRLVGETTVDGITVTVVARWAEHLDGRTAVPPHITISTPGLTEAHDLDLLPREAEALSVTLSMLGGSPWLAGVIAAGAAMLVPHDERECDGLPHFVAEDAPQRTGKDRFTWGLIRDVFDVLHAHGYRQGDDQHTGRAIGLLGDLVETYEGAER